MPHGRNQASLTIAQLRCHCPFVTLSFCWGVTGRLPHTVTHISFQLNFLSGALQKPRYLDVLVLPSVFSLRTYFSRWPQGVQTFQRLRHTKAPTQGFNSVHS
ncbi:uncharacterized protein EI90DRAFT_2289090 [Cantharellus anzutake]|uniref:uncharacterized protein n=1 Tax=Cantharellus anzutake TaxID=1750568 RepID=UPI0019060086|nr:uncharacterized protein EI90DRAFT_2289090 [Cantharellus anzutake]KAF8339825.1 hypothetical protein EI90DRAFT_2289090 [Cantharellus anzutake]